MPPVLRTQKDQPASTIAGVGKLPANGVGGLLLETAAESLRELQDGDGKPLEGAALKSAGRKFAEDRGYDVADVSDAKVEKLNELAGAAPDRPPLAEVAEKQPGAKFASTAGDAAEEVDAVVDPTEPEPAAAQG